jgi:aspartyl-tRNA(Asn)/glutamyl-tRNA(Gln) amidotransferase subunit A
MMRVSEFVSQEVDLLKHTLHVIEQCRTLDSEYHCFNVLSGDLALEESRHAQGPLAGCMVSVKDCITVKGVESRAGSRILNGYKPLFHATAVQRMIDAGALIIGKTAQDEFGFGSFSKNTGIGFRAPLNPFDKERVCGGSSGGSGALTRLATFPHISLAESTGGSIAAPAAFCGVVGLTPTYGRVSRYGLIDYANSLDKIGPMGQSIDDVARALEIIAGPDSRESTTIASPVDRYSDWVGKDPARQRIGLIKECFGEGVNAEVQDQVWRAIKKLEDQGIEYEEISLPLVARYGISTYYLIAMSESSTNLAKFCGMRYGVHGALGAGFNEYFSQVRADNFGPEAKRRIILGTFARMAGYRDAYYLKAMQVRTRIINEYKSAFKRYAALASPTMPLLPPRFTEVDQLTPLQNYLMDTMTVGPNLAGLPHLSMNAGFAHGLPVGIMLTADHLNERRLCTFGGALER